MLSQEFGQTDQFTLASRRRWGGVSARWGGVFARWGMFIILLSGLVPVVRGEDEGSRFYSIRVADLQITEGSLGERRQPQRGRRRPRQWQAYRPYVAMDRSEEAFVRWDPAEQLANEGPRESRLVIRADHDDDVTGTIFVPQADLTGLQRARFRVARDGADPQHAAAFRQVKSEHYAQLGRMGFAGRAWFRHQAGSPPADNEQPGNRRPNEFELQRTFAMFSGGRAVSENLQLDRELLGNLTAEGTQVPVNTIEGISIQEMDWTPLIDGADPQLDFLARFIPVDQHAAFFASFDAAVRIADEFRQNGRWILSLAEPTSQSAEVVNFYERQLCLTLDAVSRAVGPELLNPARPMHPRNRQKDAELRLRLGSMAAPESIVQSVAVTGSDPYFRTGTDVAVLLEGPLPELLQEVLLAKVRATALPTGLSLEAGTIGSLPYYGVQSKSREISVYIARSPQLVIVTNSRYQLQRLADVLRGKVPSLVTAPEYTFFRTRYEVGDPEEAAFVFLSDATIRRWCGPRWRIATSRRTRDAAILAELQAQNIVRMVTAAPPRKLGTEFVASSAGEFELLDVGVHHAGSGNLRFMTPLAEIPLDYASQSEKAAYEQWRDQYQRNWRWAFDPIGIRFCVDERQISADITVMPLIFNSDYRRLVNLSQGVALTEASGDPHDSLLHYALAINKESPLFQQSRGMLTAFLGGGRDHPLSWLGSSVAVYLDDGPFWQELARLPAKEAEIEEQLPRMLDHLPLAVYAEVSSGLRLTAFLAGLRAFVEQSAPGMTHWETREHEGQPYVRVSLAERGRRGMDALEDVALYYAPAGDSLTLTLDESLLQRALERASRRLGDAPAGDGPSIPQLTADWAGQNLALRVDRTVMDAVTKISSESYHDVLQARCWSNLPILNEWKRLYPERDPVELHRQLWHVQLVCPGGGDYVWNDAWQTMESTVYGHPGQPKRGPSMPPLIERLSTAAFDLTFENQGLRATIRMGMSESPSN